MVDLQVEIPIAEMQRKADLLPEAVQSGLRRVGAHAQRIAVRRAGEIYRRPIPSRSQVSAYRRGNRGGGRARRPRNVGGSTPAWRRTGNLLRAVQAEPVFEKNAVTLTAAVGYATPRHELGVTRIPREPALGIVRRNPFFAETAKIIEPQVGPLFEDGFNEVWEKS